MLTRHHDDAVLGLGGPDAGAGGSRGSQRSAPFFVQSAALDGGLAGGGGHRPLQVVDGLENGQSLLLLLEELLQGLHVGLRGVVVGRGGGRNDSPMVGIVWTLGTHGRCTWVFGDGELGVVAVRDYYHFNRSTHASKHGS